MMESQPAPTSAPAVSPGPASPMDVEMTDATAIAAAAAPATIEWSIQDSLLLLSSVERSIVTKIGMKSDMSTMQPLASQFDFTSISVVVKSQSTSQAAMGVFSGDACCQRFAQLAIESNSNPRWIAVTPFPPVSLGEICILLTMLIPKLAQARITELQSEERLHANKVALLTQGINEANAHLQAQQAKQQAEAAAQAAAAQAATQAAALPPPTPAPAPVPIASSTTGAVNVKLETVPSTLQQQRPPALMSPVAATDSSNRPSPINITSPSMIGLDTNVQWANSSLHTPLKALSRQSSVNTGVPGLASPTISRQQSLPYEQVPLTPISLSSAKIAEVFQLILSTLTTRPEADIFLEPVNPAEAQGYYEVIKNPMSFKDIREKIKEGDIASPQAFWSALQLIYNNCYTYNDKKTTFFKQAKTLEGITLDMFRKHFASYEGPWASNKKGATGRPPKYTPVTPSLTAQGSSYAAPSPLASPTASSGPSSSAGFAAIPLNLAAPGTPTASSSVQGAAPTTPSTPTRTRGLVQVPPPEEVAQVKGSQDQSRRGSVQSSTKRRDADGDETMEDVGAEAEEESVSASVGDDAVGSIHDALTTPARGGANRKRGAGAVTTAATPTPQTATPSARKNVRGTKGAPTPGSNPTASAPPSTPAPASDDPMDTSESGGDKKRRGRPTKK